MVMWSKFHQNWLTIVEVLAWTEKHTDTLTHTYIHTHRQSSSLGKIFSQK